MTYDHPCGVSSNLSRYPDVMAPKVFEAHAHQAHQPFSLVIHRPDPGQQVVCVTGPLVAGQGAERSAWSDVLGPVERATLRVDIQLDLAGVTQIDAAGLGLLAELCGAAHRRGGTVQLSAASERAGRMLRVTGVGLLFDLPAAARVKPFPSRSLKPSPLRPGADLQLPANTRACLCAAL
jgi:anti-anti-sigma factor